VALENKTPWIRVGDFFFKYRNMAFPLILLGLFVAFKPAHTYFGERRLEEWKDALAITILASGLLFRMSVIGFAYIKRGGLNKRVYAENLVTEGFFSLCRNPLYVGNMLIYTGIFLMHGNPYVFVLGTLSYFLIYSSIISAEEFFLLQKFGKAYKAYCKDVPRWIPMVAKLKEATQGMQFNFKRVLVKDYPTVAQGVLAVLLLELFEKYTFEPRMEFNQELPPYVIALVCVLAATGAIALSKRLGLLRL
jgi:protein-S-isoprenylcysteine O-methyltransferase Ste14